jgi:YHS domain-containing protein
MKTLLLYAMLMLAPLALMAQEKKADVKTETKSETAKPETKTEVKTADAKKIYNEVCPISGETVSAKTATVDHAGKTVGFCCPGCDKKFAKNPEKYIKNLSADGKTFVGKEKTM